MSKKLSPEVKLSVLLETMPWIKKYSGQIIVIKYGGNAMSDPSLQRAFAQDVVFLREWGIKPVVVHGGGPHIDRMLSMLDMETPFKAGLRVTTDEAMEVVRMVLTGQVQRELVSLINAEGNNAVGMSGEDGGLFHARRKKVVVDGEEIDLGHVGDIVKVNPESIVDIVEAGRIPVISSIAIDADEPGSVLNINADIAAANMAISMGAKKLMMLTNVRGVYENFPDESTFIHRMDTNRAKQLQEKVDAGMKPKLEACCTAIEGGVEHATVVDGRKPHAVMLEVVTDDGLGTMVRPVETRKA